MGFMNPSKILTQGLNDMEKLKITKFASPKMQCSNCAKSENLKIIEFRELENKEEITIALECIHCSKEFLYNLDIPKIYSVGTVIDNNYWDVKEYLKEHYPYMTMDSEDEQNYKQTIRTLRSDNRYLRNEIKTFKKYVKDLLVNYNTILRIIELVK